MKIANINKNGFTCPINCAQIGSWIVILTNILIFYSIQLPLSPSIPVSFNRNVFASLSGVSIIIILISTFMACFLNPSDPNLFISTEDFFRK